MPDLGSWGARRRLAPELEWLVSFSGRAVGRVIVQSCSPLKTWGHALCICNNQPVDFDDCERGVDYLICNRSPWALLEQVWNYRTLKSRYFFRSSK